MCIADSAQLLSRRGFFGSALAAGAVLGVADLGKSLLLPGVAEGAEAPAKERRSWNEWSVVQVVWHG